MYLIQLPGAFGDVILSSRGKPGFCTFLAICRLTTPTSLPTARSHLTARVLLPHSSSRLTTPSRLPSRSLVSTPSPYTTSPFRQSATSSEVRRSQRQLTRRCRRSHAPRILSVFPLCFVLFLEDSAVHTYQAESSPSSPKGIRLHSHPLLPEEADTVTSITW